jgi:hypothetical protein
MLSLYYDMALEVITAIIVTILIVGFGLIVHLTLGFLKARTNRLKIIEDNKIKQYVGGKEITDPPPVKFDKDKAIRSIIVGSITGLVLVLPQTENMGADPINDIVLSVSLVATVAGIDAIAKKSGLGEK